MSSDYQFVSTDAETLVASLISVYEGITGKTVQPASPDRLFILWVADVLVQIRAQNNDAANQNIPSRARGENLDALGELFYEKTRPAATAATCTMRFHISAVQTSSVLVPAGTRVTDASSTLFWETASDVYVPIGETYADVTVLCQTAGNSGNGYAAGQINTLVDLFAYYDSCENITASDGGADEASDAEYYQLMRASEDAYSTAGPLGGYVYWAKSVSTDIADVIALMPKDPDSDKLLGGHVYIYALMNDGTIASTTIKELILEACSAEDVRPLTDLVSVEDPGVVDYNITFTYYIPNDATLSATEIEQAVSDAVDSFVKWQSGKLGRDINPSKLYSLLMETGIKRIELTEPLFTTLGDGRDNLAPDIARAATISVTNGGYENE